MSLEAFVGALPKAELHVHLEGAMRPATLLALARRNRVSLPADDVAGLREWFRFRDFDHFVDMSSRFAKKSLLNVPGRSVKTPSSDPPALAFSARMPPTRTVISGTVSVSRLARSTSMAAGDLRWPSP